MKQRVVTFVLVILGAALVALFGMKWETKHGIALTEIRRGESITGPSIGRYNRV